MTDFKEPWEFIQRPADKTYGEEIVTEIVDAEGCVILGLRQEDDAKFIKVMERIVACINACAPILTEKLIYLRAGILSGIAADAEEANAQRSAKPFAAGTTASAAIQKLRDAGLDGWDRVADPEAEIRGKSAPLAWRKEPPDSDGIWWHCRDGDKPDLLIVFSDGPDQLVANFAFSPHWKRVLKEPISGHLWSGPIEPPPLRES